ncbi:unnamed protein product [Ixodes persulcatus]
MNGGPTCFHPSEHLGKVLLHWFSLLFMPHTTYAQKRIIKKGEISAKMGADDVGSLRNWREWEEVGGKGVPMHGGSLEKVVHPVFTDGGPRTCPTPKHRRSPKGERNSRERKQSKKHTFANPFIKFIYNNTKRILVVCLGSELFDATNSRGKLPFRRRCQLPFPVQLPGCLSLIFFFIGVAASCVFESDAVSKRWRNQLF